MKTLITIILGLALIQTLPENEDQEYFYFGNTNLIGVGSLEEGKKEGTWKIYGRINELDAPRETVEAVQNVDLETEFDLNTPLYHINFKENLPNGIMEEFYPDGQIKKLVSFSKGQLNGDFFEFSPTGEMMLSGRYLEDQKTGEWASFFPNGTKKSEFNYRENLLEGITKNFYPNGVLAEIIPFESGKIQGVYKSFFQNGSPFKSVQFEAGVENGDFRLFFEDGQLNVACSFSAGELDGEWESYDNLGNLLSKGTYQRGIRSGEWKEQIPELLGFYRLGNYAEGNRSGAWKVIEDSDFVYQEEFFEAGKLISISEFTIATGQKLNAGKLNNGNGKRTVFKKDGDILEKGRYSKGLRSGIWYTFFPKSDRVASSGSYVDGQKYGTWKYYGLNGEFLSEESFGTRSPSEIREAATFDNHNLARQDFGRNLVAEPVSANDLRFLERFKRPNIPRSGTNF